MCSDSLLVSLYIVYDQMVSSCSLDLTMVPSASPLIQI